MLSMWLLWMSLHGQVSQPNHQVAQQTYLVSCPAGDLNVRCSTWDSANTLRLQHIRATGHQCVIK